MRNSLKLFILAAVCSVTAGCNKDEVLLPEENGYFRPATSGSSAYCDRVYEWTPAPGQFINEAAWGGPMADPEEAASWAEGRFEKRLAVSLGGFGGYIVVGFDHSIAASPDGGYDFGVGGNAFFESGTESGGSNEPGIVYVMQDENGNGLPDDTWFELSGSESGNPATIRGYEVTYYRPDSAGCKIAWTDNCGGSGFIPYMGMFHSQDSYYPAWVRSDSYTLRGTRLEALGGRNESTGRWETIARGGGYADNMGCDNIRREDFHQCNRFRIADAVAADGSPANLEYIDFVKIQTGVNGVTGALGEVSTEVCGVVDLNL